MVGWRGVIVFVWVLPVGLPEISVETGSVPCPCFQCKNAEVLKKNGEERKGGVSGEKLGRPGNDIEVRK